MATVPALSTSAGGAAIGGSNPNPNACVPKLRSPPGKSVLLADNTNTGRPTPARSVHIADVLKENTKLRHLLSEKTKVIESSKVEMLKLRLVLQALREQNLHLVQDNCQMLAELNQGKDRLKALQHELSCTTAVLNVKASELELKKRTANQLRKEGNSMEVIEIPSKLAAVEVHQIYNKATSAAEHHLVETQFAEPLITGCIGTLQDTNKRTAINKRWSELCEGIKNTVIAQHNKLHLQSTGSLHHKDLRQFLLIGPSVQKILIKLVNSSCSKYMTRKPLQRRSARLNQGSCEVTEVSCETLHEDAFVPSVPSSFSVPKLREPRPGKDMSSQNELPCNATLQGVKALDLKNNEINEQQKKVNLEIQEACAKMAGVEAHEISDKASNTNRNHLVENQFNVEYPEPPQGRSNRRKSLCSMANKQKLELCEDLKDSDIDEETGAKWHPNSSEPRYIAEKMESRRRKSSRLNPRSCEVTKGTSETLHEDVTAALTPTRKNENQKQNDCYSTVKSSEEQVTERSLVGRPLRRAAKKTISYKEVPLNVKMRRP